MDIIKKNNFKNISGRYGNKYMEYGNHPKNETKVTKENENAKGEKETDNIQRRGLVFENDFESFPLLSAKNQKHLKAATLIKEKNQTKKNTQINNCETADDRDDNHPVVVDISRHNRERNSTISSSSSLSSFDTKSNDSVLNAKSAHKKTKRKNQMTFTISG